MESSASSKNANYVFHITYHKPTPPVNIATYTLTPTPETVFSPGDTVTFKFTNEIAPHKATLTAGYKDLPGDGDSSPFYNDANSIDILSFPTLTLGSNFGRWGFVVSFSVEVSDTTHFFYLPDPEIIIGPKL